MVAELWSAEAEAPSSRALWLLDRDDPIEHCAVFDFFSYCHSTAGEWGLSGLDGVQGRMLLRARELLSRLWAGEVRGHREEMLASCLHVLWRTLEPQDVSHVLRAMRQESGWRVLWPCVSAMIFLRGQDVDVDRESSRLLAGIVRRDDLDGMVRDLAIEALAAGASAEDLRTFVALLSTLEVVVGLIAATQTATGLKVKAAADQKTYRTGIKVTDAEMAALDLRRDDFHGEWNYTIKPRAETAPR